MNPMALMGGLAGGGVSTSTTATSGDAQSGFDAVFQYNAGFSVGSGAQNQQTAQQTSDKGGGGSQTGLYVALGVAALAIVVLMLNGRRA